MTRKLLIALALGSLSLVAPASAAYAYSRAGTYDVQAVPPPGWKSQYPIRGGAPIVTYPPPIGAQRNPVTTAQYGLGRWNTAITYHLRAELRKAEHAGLWLVHNQAPSGKWLYTFDAPAGWPGWGPELEMHAPWASALAQGQAISLLTRLYRHTGRRLFLTAAEKALVPLMESTAEGGLQTRYEGGVWLEEAPSAKPSYILNGFLMAIVGVYDIADLDPPAQKLWQAVADTAAACLPAFDTGSGNDWYDLIGRYGQQQGVPPVGYGPIIARTLELLDVLSPHPNFATYAKAWANAP